MAFTSVVIPSMKDQYAFSSLRTLFRRIDITSYTTGGETINPSDVGMLYIFAVFGIAKENNYVIKWDGTSKLLALGDKGTATAGGALEEAPSTTNVGEIDIIIFGV